MANAAVRKLKLFSFLWRPEPTILLTSSSALSPVSLGAEVYT